MIPDINEVMSGLGDYVDRIDGILRHGHERYEAIPSDLALDYDASCQAHMTFHHLKAEAHRVLDGLPGVRHTEVGQLNVWHIKPANAVIRFKKTDEDGVHSNTPTRQQREFDSGGELPGIPPAPTRLVCGYLLDRTGTEFKRSQVTLPTAGGVAWCAAIVPLSAREEGERSWQDVTRQRRFGHAGG